MTFISEMCNSRKNVYERQGNLRDVVKETLRTRESDLDELIKNRDYFRLELSVIEAKIEKLEKLDKLYKQEYGI